VLDLLSPSFSTAQAVAEAINAASGAPLAQPLDAMSVAIAAPADPAARVALAARLEALAVQPAVPPARVVVNARTGTVVIGGNVRVLPTGVAHGNLTVSVTETRNVSQPAPFGRGRTVVTPQSDVAADEQVARMSVVAPGPLLKDLVDAINALGAAPGDLVAILEALREAGALRAELVVI
jgi:flagellar P-ring protein precursor FlgI